MIGIDQCDREHPYNLYQIVSILLNLKIKLKFLFNYVIKFNGNIPDLSEHKCASYEDCMDFFNNGKKNRVQASTKLNCYSSRSHSIFSIKIITNVGKNLKEGILNLVDLAGSESQKKADTSKRGFEEAIKINLSNFHLGQTILALSEKMKPSYRDSKLTHVLQSALGGDGKTLLITNITPSSHLYSETLNSLKYADRAQKIPRKLLPNTEKLFRYSVKLFCLYRKTFFFGYQYRKTFSVIYAETNTEKLFR